MSKKASRTVIEPAPVMCPFCGSSNTRITSTHQAAFGNVARYRVCGKCGRTFVSLRRPAV